jgi:hypothetical protein
MKDGISLLLIFLVAVTIESAVWVWLPMVVAIFLLQYDKIEEIIKNNTTL